MLNKRSLRRLSHRKRLVDRGHNLADRKLVETLAAAVEPALAALQLARQARQWILHEPDIAAMLDRAGGSPWAVETAERPRSPQARIGRAIKCDGRRPGGGGEVGDRGVRPDIDARGGDQSGQSRPVELAVETDDIAVTPDFIEIGTIGCSAGDGRAEAALVQRRGESPPAAARPALIGEHRRRMNYGVWLRRRERRAHAACGTDDLGLRWDADEFGKAQYIEDAMLAAVAHIGTAEREALDGSREAVRFHRTSALPPGNDRQECRPVAGLRRQREVITFAEPQHQRQRFAGAGTLREREDFGKMGLPVKIPSVPAKTSASIEASGNARFTLRISGVVNSTSPSRRNATMSTPGVAGNRMGFIVAPPKHCCARARRPRSAQRDRAWRARGCRR